MHDPEILVNIYELGLISEITIYPMNNVHIRMTQTSPSFPAAEFIPGRAESIFSPIKLVEDSLSFLTLPCYTLRCF